jgi:diacylglycerol kinase family enzyme
MPVDVIVNTTAALHAARPGLLEGIRRLCEGIAVVHATATLGELDAVVCRIRARGSELVILSGGDGSVAAGVTAVARRFGEGSLPRFGFLPCGAVSTIAHNLGFRGNPLALLRRMLDVRRPRAARTCPTLRVSSCREGEWCERLGFIFGTGLVARFFDVYYRGAGRGSLAAARIVARVFLESFWGGVYAHKILDPIACSLEVDGRALPPLNWSLGCAAVVRDLGLHMRVTHRAGEDPRRPHVVASALSPRELGPRAPWVIAGRPIGGPEHFDDLASELTVRFLDRESTCLSNGGEGPYVLDGDVFSANVVRVAAGPELRLVMG